MINIKKVLKLEIFSLIVNIVIILNIAQYSYSLASEETLRIPMDTIERVEKLLSGDKNKALLSELKFEEHHIREGLRARMFLNFVKTLVEKLIIMDWIGLDATKTACMELADNVTRFGKRGYIASYYDIETSILEVTSIDEGPGFEDPNKELRNSIKIHEEVHLNRPLFNPPGMGFLNIVEIPDEVIIESKGKKWVKKGRTTADLGLEYVEPSDIIIGAKITLKFRDRRKDQLFRSTAPLNHALPANQTRRDL